MAAVVAAACVDFKHDGLNNEFQKNKQSERAVRFKNESVNENYSAAEAWALLGKEETNFLAELGSESVQQFKKRMTAAIIATDMSKHKEHTYYF